ncbi:pyrroloquinoline quinone biosynthesis protein PqqE [compost metagenome]
MPDNRKKEFMSEDNFKNILDSIKDYTDYIYLHVKGEPLIHPNINSFIDIAYSMGFKVNITTNGTLIDNLVTKNIRQINYSLQSRNNILEIRDTIRKIRNYVYGTSIYVSLRLWTDKSKFNDDLKQMLIEEFPLLSYFEDIQNKKKTDENIFLSIESEFDWPDINSSTFCEEGYCHGLKDHIAILVDGTVVPCCLDHRANISLGNIFDEELNDIIESSRAKEILNGFKNRKAVEELCKKCTFKNKFLKV